MEFRQRSFRANQLIFSKKHDTTTLFYLSKTLCEHNMPDNILNGSKAEMAFSWAATKRKTMLVSKLEEKYVYYSRRWMMQNVAWLDVSLHSSRDSNSLSDHSVVFRDQQWGMMTNSQSAFLFFCRCVTSKPSWMVENDWFWVRSCGQEVGGVELVRGTFLKTCTLKMLIALDDFWYVLIYSGATWNTQL